MGEIAEQMQRTKSAVRTRALKLNIAIARAENSMQRGKRQRRCATAVSAVRGAAHG